MITGLKTPSLSGSIFSNSAELTITESTPAAIASRNTSRLAESLLVTSSTHATALDQPLHADLGLEPAQLCLGILATANTCQEL
ncbi:hypothetical protein GCM10022275_34740 [Tessaracoccus defluvii]